MLQGQKLISCIYREDLAGRKKGYCLWYRWLILRDKPCWQWKHNYRGIDHTSLPKALQCGTFNIPFTAVDSQNVGHKPIYWKGIVWKPQHLSKNIEAIFSIRPKLNASLWFFIKTEKKAKNIDQSKKKKMKYLVLVSVASCVCGLYTCHGSGTVMLSCMIYVYQKVPIPCSGTSTLQLPKTSRGKKIESLINNVRHATKSLCKVYIIKLRLFICLIMRFLGCFKVF